MQPIMKGQPGQNPALSDHACLFRTEVKSRDVDQPCLQRQEYVLKGSALTRFVQLVQRNRLIQPERTGAQTAQHGDMADAAQRQRNVAGKAADVGALGNMGDEGDFILCLPGTGGGTIRRMVVGAFRQRSA